MQPDLVMNNVDLDKLLFKFENFGQDHLVSENLQGKLTSRIKEKSEYTQIWYQIWINLL